MARYLSAVAAVGVPTGLVGAHALLYGRWVVDDAGITFAYARSIANGEGPVLQPGSAPVEGYSNPAWLALLVAGRWLGLFDRGTWFAIPDYVAFPKLLALVCVAGMFVCFYAVARTTTSWPAIVTVVAGTVTAAVPSFVVWTMSGLENALLVLVTAGIASVLVRAAVAGQLFEVKPALWCGLLAAVAALTRPDGLIYAGAYPLAVLVLLRRDQLGAAVRAVMASMLAFAGPAGAYLGWRLATFGQWLPNTALAKAQDTPTLADVARLGELSGYVGLPLAMTAAAAVTAGLAMRSPERGGMVVLLVPLTLALGAYVVLEADWMRHYRFATPVWALTSLAAAVGGARLLTRIPSLRAGAVVLVVAVGVLAVSAPTLVGHAAQGRKGPVAPLCVVAQSTGRSANGYADYLQLRAGSLLAPDIGGVALTSRLRTVDLAGLADAHIAAFWNARDWAGLRDYVFEQVRPTFISAHGGWSSTTGITLDPRFGWDYAEIATVAGSTDWVRRDILTSPADLDGLRAYAAAVTLPADFAQRAAPRGSCGNILTPGSDSPVDEELRVRTRLGAHDDSANVNRK